MNINANILNNILAHQIQEQITKTNHHHQVGFIPKIQGCPNIQKSVSVIDHINKLKEKYHMIITLDAERISEKSNIPLLKKILERLGIQVTYFNRIKAIYS